MPLSKLWLFGSNWSQLNGQVFMCRVHKGGGQQQQYLCLLVLILNFQKGKYPAPKMKLIFSCVIFELSSTLSSVVVSSWLRGIPWSFSPSKLQWNLSVVVICGPKIFGLVREVMGIKLANLIYCWYLEHFWDFPKLTAMFTLWSTWGSGDCLIQVTH